MNKEINITIIFGCVKSVTSATAMVFERHGVFFGETGGKRSDNPKGTRENAKIMALMQEMCRKTFGHQGKINRGIGWESLRGTIPFDLDAHLQTIPELRSRVFSIMKADGWDGTAPLG